VPKPILESSFAAITWPLNGDLIEIRLCISIRSSEPIEADYLESCQWHKNRGKKEISDGRPYLGIFGLQARQTAYTTEITSEAEVLLMSTLQLVLWLQYVYNLLCQDTMLCCLSPKNPIGRFSSANFLVNPAGFAINIYQGYTDSGHIFSETTFSHQAYLPQLQFGNCQKCYTPIDQFFSGGILATSLHLLIPSACSCIGHLSSVSSS
jgi:hypothetical protein